MPDNDLTTPTGPTIIITPELNQKLIPTITLVPPGQIPTFFTDPDPELDPNLDPDSNPSKVQESVATRLQKLAQKYAIISLQNEQQAENFSENLFNDICDHVIASFQQDPTKIKIGREEHYDPVIHNKFSDALIELRKNIIGTPERNGNHLKIKLKDNHELNMIYQPGHHRILFSSSNPNDSSLVLLLEEILKAAIKVKTNQIIIYPGADIDQVATLCAMAKKTGLTPVFKPNPSTPESSRDSEFEDFNKKLTEKFQTIDAKEVASKVEHKIEFKKELEPKSNSNTQPSSPGHGGNS